MSLFSRTQLRVFAAFLRDWLPVAIWCSCMFTASSDLMSAPHTSRFVEPFLRWLIPGISQGLIEEVHWTIRKGAHLTEYAILAGLLRHAIAHSRRNFTEGFYWKITLQAWGLATLFAATDEFHQAFVPSRGSSVTDVLIDACGAALGLTILAIIDGIKERASYMEAET